MTSIRARMSSSDRAWISGSRPLASSTRGWISRSSRSLESTKRERKRISGKVYGWLRRRPIGAGRALSVRRSAHQVPETRSVAYDQEHERQHGENQPEDDRPTRRGGVHLRVAELRQLLASQAGAPPRQVQLVAPVRICDPARLEVPLAIGTVKLEAHRSPWFAAEASCGGSAASSPPAPSPSAPLPPSSPSASCPGSLRRSSLRATPSSQRSISWVNETSLENRAPTDSPRWIRLIASPMSGATEMVRILASRLAGGSGIVSVRPTSRRLDSRIRSMGGSVRAPWVAQA